MPYLLDHKRKRKKKMSVASSKIKNFVQDFVPDLLNHVLFISLHVRAVELVMLVKPMGINYLFLSHMLMTISFGTKFPTLLNTSVLLKVVGISVTFLVLRFSMMQVVKESFHIEQLKPELNEKLSLLVCHAF